MDSTRSLGAMVVVVDAETTNVVGAVLNVSSSLGAPQLATRATTGRPQRKYRMNDLDMSASADAGIAKSDVD
jgi:hypothetical protein